MVSRCATDGPASTQDGVTPSRAGVPPLRSEVPAYRSRRPSSSLPGAARARALPRVRQASDLGHGADGAPVVLELSELLESDLEAHVDALLVHLDHLVRVHVP